MKKSPIEIDNNPFVSVNEINSLIPNLNSDEDIEIEFRNYIDRVDIFFLAFLFLQKTTNNISFSIKHNGIDRRRIFEVRQYLRQIDILYEVDWRYVVKRFEHVNNEPLEKISSLDNEKFTSESFSPILLINKRYYDFIFNKTESNHLPKGFSRILDNYKRLLLNKSIISEREYFNSTESIINEDFFNIPINILVFIVVYHKLSPFKRGVEVSESINRVEEIKNFTIEYINGLKELAKNIVEHSSTRQGIITLRAYDSTDKEHINYGNKLLETYVLDLGEIGIIDTLTKHTLDKLKTNYTVHTKRIYEEDLELIKKGYTLKDFVFPKPEIKLNQQLYRDLAHYGLMKFNKLVERNEGFVYCSSISQNNSRDLYNNDSTTKFKPINTGTSYYIQLPFKSNLFKATERLNQANNMGVSIDSINALSKILEYEVINHIEFNFNNENGNKKWILDFEINETINDRNQESILLNRLEIDASLNPSIYISMNMREVTISSSSLLRVLAFLSNKYHNPIIVYNLDYELFDEMISENEEFYNYVNDLETRTPYWFSNKSILVFTVVRSLAFNCADLLFGENYNDFISANKIVSNTFPNSTTILRDDYIESTLTKIPPCLSSFFYQSSLLPFDLLLKGKNDQTIFQNNLEYLVNQELKIITNE